MATIQDGQVMIWNAALKDFVAGYAESIKTSTNIKRVELYASLTAAVAAIGSTPTRLTCSSATTITANTTIPSNIYFEPLFGCIITAASAFNLTINGGLNAGPYKWLGTNVTLKFSQSDSTITVQTEWVFAEWFGAVGNDSTDDTAAFNAAFAAMKTSRGIPLRLLARAYRANAVIPIPSGSGFPICIFGTGEASAIRANTGSLPALSCDFSAGSVNAILLFRDFSLNSRNNHSAPVLSLITGGGTSGRFFGTISNVHIIGGGGTLADCAYIKGGLGLNIDLRTEAGRYALYLEDTSNAVVTIHAGNATCNGVMIKSGGNNTIIRARIEDSNTPNTRVISSIAGSAGLVTVVTTTPHNLEDMDRVTISGVTGATAYNFTSPRRITVVNSTTFRYAGSETGSGSGGTVLISASALRFKNSEFNTVYDFANEGKENLDYVLWLQSDGTTISGEPSCSHNTFCGAAFSSVANTVRTELSTILLEGACAGNRGYGVTVGHSVVLNSNSWEIRHERNAVGIRPRNNYWEGSLYSGTGSSYNFHFYEEIEGGFANYAELYNRGTERVMTAGNRSHYNFTRDIDENQLGGYIYTDGASATVVISFTFEFFPGMKLITFVNNSNQLLRIDPFGTDVIGTGGAGKYLELPAGASVVLGCFINNKGAIMFSSGTLTYEP